MGLGDVIKRAREQAGLSQEALGKLLGVSGQSVGQWESGKTAPSGANTLKLIDMFQLDANELFGPPLVVRESRAGYRPTPCRAAAPLYGSVSAGTPRESIEASEMVPVPEDVLSEHPAGFFLRVSGSCMDRVLPDGAYAFVDPDAPVVNGDVAAVIVNAHEATIKRFHRHTTTVVLQPDSHDPSFTDQIFDYSKRNTDEVRLIGKVVWFTMPYGGRL